MVEAGRTKLALVTGTVGSIQSVRWELEPTLLTFLMRLQVFFECVHRIHKVPALEVQAHTVG